ncbi:MAG: acyltransferase family protein [Clostridiaceae bacterium]
MNTKLLQVDLLKGLAIISVIILHTLSYDNLVFIKAEFHIWQAVPVFMILMGLTSYLSFSNKVLNLKNLYSTEYFIKRFKRIVLPFVIIFLLSFFLGLVQGKVSFNKLTILGYLPVTGPGNYYITILFQFIFLFPIMFYIIKRYPNLGLLLMFLINLTFELISPHILFFKTNIYYYNSSIFRYLFAIALGIWIGNKKTYSKNEKLFISLGFIFSTVYLILSVFFNFKFIYFIPVWRTQNLLSFFYPLIIVLLGIKFLPPKSNNILAKLLAFLGKASYHIFLFQILFFSLIAPYLNSLYVCSNFLFAKLLINLIITLTCGSIFFKTKGLA